MNKLSRIRAFFMHIATISLLVAAALVLIGNVIAINFFHWWQWQAYFALYNFASVFLFFGVTAALVALTFMAYANIQRWYLATLANLATYAAVLTIVFMTDAFYHLGFAFSQLSRFAGYILNERLWQTDNSYQAVVAPLVVIFLICVFAAFSLAVFPRITKFAKAKYTAIKIKPTSMNLNPELES
jgi:hypothetical protein